MGQTYTCFAITYRIIAYSKSGSASAAGEYPYSPAIPGNVVPSDGGCPCSSLELYGITTDKTARTGKCIIRNSSIKSKDLPPDRAIALFSNKVILVDRQICRTRSTNVNPHRRIARGINGVPGYLHIRSGTCQLDIKSGRSNTTFNIKAVRGRATQRKVASAGTDIDPDTVNQLDGRIVPAVNRLQCQVRLVHGKVFRVSAI